jgi:hypothetical protein
MPVLGIQLFDITGNPNSAENHEAFARFADHSLLSMQPKGFQGNAIAPRKRGAD